MTSSVFYTDPAPSSSTTAPLPPSDLDDISSSIILSEMEQENRRYWMCTRRKLTGAKPTLSGSESWEKRAFEEDTLGLLQGGCCVWPPRSYSCSFCMREFRSAQALGGHMNVHRRDRARLQLRQRSPALPTTPESNNSQQQQLLLLLQRQFCPPNPPNLPISSPARVLLRRTHEEKNCGSQQLNLFTPVPPPPNNNSTRVHHQDRRLLSGFFPVHSSPSDSLFSTGRKVQTSLGLRLREEDMKERKVVVGSKDRRWGSRDEEGEEGNSTSSYKRAKVVDVDSSSWLSPPRCSMPPAPHHGAATVGTVEEVDLELRLGVTTKVNFDVLENNIDS